MNEVLEFLTTNPTFYLATIDEEIKLEYVLLVQ